MGGEQLIINLVIWTICGTICAAIASAKGRNVVGWFFLGFLFCPCIIIVACLPNLKVEQARREQVDSEQRRLREQLRQERIKTETFRQYALGRLDSHDRVLGVDTRAGIALPGAIPGQALPAPAEGAGAPGQPRPLSPVEELASAVGAPSPQPPPGVFTSQKSWYYEDAGAPKGPVAAEEIRRLLQGGLINSQTLLWCEDMVQWTAAAEVDDFRYEAF